MTPNPSTTCAGLLLASALTLTGATACGGTSTVSATTVPAVFTPQPEPWRTAAAINWPADGDLRAWMREHPVPARPGMTPAVVSFYGYVSGRAAPCPRSGRGSVGDPGVCWAWQVTLVTPAGTLKLACGTTASPPLACASAVYPQHATALDLTQPTSGDYLYAPGDGQVSAGHDVKIIRRDAIPLPGGQ